MSKTQPRTYRNVLTMKARNKSEKKIYELRDKVQRITKEQIKYACDNHTKFVAISYSKRHTCLECNHEWNADHSITIKKGKSTCPSCGGKLTLMRGYYPHKREAYYYAIIDRIEDKQLIRVFMSNKFYHRKKRPHHFVSEVIQHYIEPNGKIQTITKSCQTMGTMYYDSWISHSSLEFRKQSQKQNWRENSFCEVVFPKKKIIPILKRNGFKTSFHGINPHKLVQELLSNNNIETLFKRGQIKIVKHLMKNPNIDKDYQKAINVALRHNYKINDVDTYIDYLSMLRHHGFDLMNPFYVCPMDLKQEHDRLIAKKEKIDEIERVIKNENYQKTYEKYMKKFFGLRFQSGGIVIEPLKTIEEFYQEGKELNHCVYKSNYYEKKHNLVFSAKVKGKRTETILYNLKSKELIYSLGQQNEKTKYNKQIVELFNKNESQILNIAI